MSQNIFLGSRLSIKKNLFPVQRVAKIEVSRAAANLFFSPLFFNVKYLTIASFFFLPETELFLWTALGQILCNLEN